MLNSTWKELSDLDRLWKSDMQNPLNKNLLTRNEKKKWFLKTQLSPSPHVILYQEYSQIKMADTIHEWLGEISIR